MAATPNAILLLAAKSAKEDRGISFDMVAIPLEGGEVGAGGAVLLTAVDRGVGFPDGRMCVFNAGTECNSPPGRDTAVRSNP